MKMTFCSQDVAVAYSHPPVLLPSPLPSPHGGHSGASSPQRLRFLAFLSPQGPVLQLCSQAQGGWSNFFVSWVQGSESALCRAYAKPSLTDWQVTGSYLQLQLPGKLPAGFLTLRMYPEKKRSGLIHNLVSSSFGGGWGVVQVARWGPGGRPLVLCGTGWQSTLQGGNSSKEPR